MYIYILYIPLHTHMVGISDLGTWKVVWFIRRYHADESISRKNACHIISYHIVSYHVIPTCLFVYMCIHLSMRRHMLKYVRRYLVCRIESHFNSWRFPQISGTTKMGWKRMENPKQKWMMTGDTPMSGKLHWCLYICSRTLFRDPKSSGPKPLFSFCHPPQMPSEPTLTS